jgi:hypothetical protein
MGDTGYVRVVGFYFQNRKKRKNKKEWIMALIPKRILQLLEYN